MIATNAMLTTTLKTSATVTHSSPTSRPDKPAASHFLDKLVR